MPTNPVKKTSDPFSSYRYIYFLGIGGIGMSSLARYFHLKKKEVYGYDQTSTTLTQQLIKEGISLYHTSSISSVPMPIRKNLSQTLVIYTPAIPKDHVLLQFFQKKYKIYKRAEILGILSQSYYTIAIAGTHGKTTTTALIAHFLYQAKHPFISFLGGIIRGYEKNFLSYKAADKNALLVVEADEYDHSFLKLHPNIAVITAIDEDHLEIYQDKNNLYKAFQTFLQKKKAKGKSIIAHEIFHALKDPCAYTYGLQKGDIQAENIAIEKHQYTFNYCFQEKKDKIYMPLPGLYNIQNALAAITVGLFLEIEMSVLHNALATFPGIHRRFEVKINQKNILWIDDYAHHPEEIKVFLQTVKALYPDYHLKAIFQPHLYSRTKDFAQAFGQSLSLAEEVFLLPIYPAREKPIPGVTSECILQYITTKKKYIQDPKNFFSCCAPFSSKPTLWTTIGAGNIASLFDQSLKRMI